MNLLNIKKRVRSFIREPKENYIKDKELNDWINDANFEATKELNYPWKEMILYSVAGQSDYDYPTDFHTLHPLLSSFFNKLKLDKFDVQWMEREYPDFQKASNVDQPEEFYARFEDKISIYPPPSLIASGTATAGSATDNLLDTAASFVSTYVGYAVHNTTDGSYGLITAVNGDGDLTAALTGGTNNVWAENDEYTINKSGTVPYVYKEADMTEDAHESKVAAKFPYLLIYRVLPMAEIKCFRVSSSQKEQNRAERWEKLYTAELIKSRSIVNRYIRGRHGKSKVAGEW
jgi:hypothetical protein